MSERGVVLVGYSGHAFVVHDILTAMGRSVAGYCEPAEKALDPYRLAYLGRESDPATLELLAGLDYFVAIGDNAIRRRSTAALAACGHPPTVAVHPSAVVSPSTRLSPGAMVAPRVVINALASIGDGVICNTSCIIEHECVLEAFVHVAPSAVLCGNVTVGEGTFVGANSVVRQGVRIGRGVLIGAGAVVVRDVADGARIAGNPARPLPAVRS